MAETDVPAIIQAVKELARTPIFGGDVKPGELALYDLPAGRTIHDLQPYLDRLRDAPKRIETTAKASTVDSFIAYLSRFKEPDTAIFADDLNPKEPKLVGIIDFHGQSAGAAPRFGAHKIVYEFPVSDQIKEWSAISGKEMTHEAFASFLAERQYDIVNPPLDWMQVEPATIELLLHLLNLSDDHGNLSEELDNPGSGMTSRDRRAAAAARVDDGPDQEPDDRYIPRSALYKLRQIRFGKADRMVQLGRTVELSIDSKVTEGYNPKTGERTIVFKDEYETRGKDGKQVIVPDACLLGTPIWEGETSQLVPVRVQYRRKGGNLHWFLTLVEWKRVVRHAVKVEAERVREKTGIPVFYGKASS